MNKLIKKVLTKIESNGFEAYIIGGYVRDLLIGKTTCDIDICTNATHKDLIAIFPSGTTHLGSLAFKIKEYHFEITTYREEITYENRKPIKYNYKNSLIDDLKRRDFTINTICMNSKGEIIDILNGTKDLNNLEIKMIGDINKKLQEDPLRIMRAIRFSTVLNFNLEPNLYKGLKKYAKLILTLSNTRIKEELDKILLSNYSKKGLNLLADLGILKLLNMSYHNIVVIKNLEGMYAQIDMGYKLPFTKQERNTIMSIKNILKSNEITPFTLYKYGLYLTTVSGEILNINQKEITKMYKALPIKDKKDININPKEIIKILGNEYSKKINYILNTLENLILSGKIKNKKSNIMKYLIDNKAKWKL